VHLPLDVSLCGRGPGPQTVATSLLWSHKAAELVRMLRDEPFAIDVLAGPADAG
jgi:hypothetical protein